MSWTTEQIVALYEGILRRTPTTIEAENLRRELDRTDNLKGAITDMLGSHEFGISMVADLVHEHTTGDNSRRVFFLHVPKTAGTAFRLALTDAFGTPAYLLYSRTSWSGYLESPPMALWPLWAGHAGISSFPTSHRGITVFRESRSRTLSQYRQQQRNFLSGVVSNPRRLLDENLERLLSRRALFNDSFSDWLDAQHGAIPFFVTPPDDPSLRMWHGVARHKYVDSLSAPDLAHNLAATWDRFDAAAWSHDATAMATAISRITGNPNPDPMREHNSFHEVDGVHDVTLTRRDLERLEDLAHREQILVSTAVDAGLIPPLDNDIADEQFEKTARRLGFTFA